MRWGVAFSICVLLSASAALAEEATRSNTIVQGEHTYLLTVRDGALVLSTTSARDDGVVHRPLVFDIPAGGRVTEIRLEPWVSNHGLCAVVEVFADNEYQYSCVTLTAPTRSDDYDSASARFHTSTVNHSILAVNGTFRGDSVLALLGVVELKHGVASVVSSGLVFLHDCPAPPSRGSISTFKAATEIEPGLLELINGDK